MTDGIMISIGDDGVARMYDDTYDITIHCESKEEQDEVMKRLRGEGERDLDEWCTDCKEYDHERHCCPRYNRVIRESLAEIADERLVSKKPNTYYSNPPYKTLMARCPNCKRPLRPGRTYRNPDLYCPRCGQAIDWSEVEE